MSQRAPAPPPELRGYTYIRLLGSGGFADVFLYQQHMPRRQVAVKVLLSDVVTETVREQFHAEANLMAQVSTHPFIVSVHHADIADDGRPYLVMEYCPRANLSVRYQNERIAVAEALRIGVRLAGAVETAHRTGILHRDIKPANVLTTEYGWPALTDFGISSAAGQTTEAAGMSVPWSPPEMFAEPPVSDERADVWSLGATVYTLLARRSPFERPGGPNTALDLIARIEKDPLPALGRDDVPPALVQVLDRSMAKRPASRYRSALDLARALQEVEISLQLAPTAIDVRDTSPETGPDDDESEAGRTRIRNLVTITPQAPAPRAPVLDTAAAATAAPRTVGPAAGATVVRAPAAAAGTERPAAWAGQSAVVLPAPEVGETVHRPAAAPVEEAVEEAPPGSRRTAVLAGAAALVLLLVVALAFLLPGGEDPAQSPSAEETEAGGTDDALVLTVPVPVDLVATPADGGTSFSWSNPDPQPGDVFLWRRTDPGAETTLAPVEEPQVLVQAAGRVCVEVLLRRSNGRVSDQAAAGCTP